MTARLPTLLFTLVVLCWPKLAVTADELQFGFSEKDISPEIGMEQPGGYGKSFHRSQHDPCKVRAAVFQSGAKRVAVVSVDALMVPRQLVLTTREQIEKQTGIPADSVLIHATHSHSSGPTGMIQPGEYDHGDALVQKLAYQDSSCANADYLRTVRDQIVAAVAEADQRRQVGSYSIGRGHEDRVAFNRRFKMRNGLTFTHPRQGNPEIIEPAGPVDPEVGVIGGWTEDGKLAGCLVNFVCHATTNPGGSSANYIYYVERTIRGLFGEDVVVVFLAGASGDVTQVNNLSPARNPSSQLWAQRVGGCVGAEAVKVLLLAPRSSEATLDSKILIQPMKRRVPAAERVAECRELVQRSPAEVGRTRWTFAKEIVLLDAKLSKEPQVDVEVQAIQIGAAVLLTDPAEFFCQLGLDIKRQSPFPFTFPVSLANGCVGYVPTEEAFHDSGGGYETRLTSYSNLRVDAGPRMVEMAVRLAKQLKPDAGPAFESAPTFTGAGWEYGSVPPEKQ